MRFQFPTRSLILLTSLLAVFFTFNAHIDVRVSKYGKSGTEVTAVQGWPLAFGEHYSNPGYDAEFNPAEFDGKLNMEYSLGPLVFNVVVSLGLGLFLTIAIQRLWRRSKWLHRISFVAIITTWLAFRYGYVSWPRHDWLVVSKTFIDRLTLGLVADTCSSLLFCWPFDEDSYRWGHPVRVFSVEFARGIVLGLILVCSGHAILHWRSARSKIATSV